MSRRKRRLVIAVVSVVGVAMLACNGGVTLPAAVRGGGWIPAGDKKATFGFQVTCDADTGEVKGQFEYNDHQQKEAFHAVMDYDLDGCVVPAGAPPCYEGTYSPQPRNRGDGGDLLLCFDEAGETFYILLSGGVFDGSVYGGAVEGGHIEVWEQED